MSILWDTPLRYTDALALTAIPALPRPILLSSLPYYSEVAYKCKETIFFQLILSPHFIAKQALSRPFLLDFSPFSTLSAGLRPQKNKKKVSKIPSFLVETSV